MDIVSRGHLSAGRAHSSGIQILGRWVAVGEDKVLSNYDIPGPLAHIANIMKLVVLFRDTQ